MDQLGQEAEAYTALIGDILKSRDLKDRSLIQARFATAIQELNQKYGHLLAAPLVMTAGDEVQGLFRRPGKVVSVLTAISEDMFPVGVNFGVGFGSLSTELHERTPLLDGPCFHRAREALDTAAWKHYWARWSGFGRADEILNGCFRLMQEVRDGWTAIQVRHVQAARRMSQKEVAHRFGKAQSTISQSLNAAGFASIQAAEEAMMVFLEDFVFSRDLGEAFDASP